MTIRKQKTASFVLAAMGLALTLPAQADTKKIPYLTIEKTVTIAGLTEQKIKDVLTSTTVITRDEIEASNAYSVADVIANTPGVEVSRNGGPGTVTSFFLRGQASINLVIMVDGVRSQTNALATIKAVDIPLSNIEQIEIIRGNAGALYGEAAIGGVINIITKKGAGAPKATAAVTYGSHDTKEATASYGGEVNGTSFMLTASDYSSEGYSAINPIKKPTANPDKDGAERQSLFASASTSLTDAIEVGASFSSIDTETEYDAGTAWDLATDTHLLKTISDDISAFVKYTDGGWTNRLTVTESDLGYRDFKNGAAAPWNAVIDADQTNIRYVTNYAFEANGNYHQISGGLETTSASYTNDGDTHKRSQDGKFVGYNGNFNRFDVQLNAREDTIKAKDATTVKNDATSYLVGAGYHINDEIKVTASQSTGFRAPSNEELYGWGGNQNLKAEEHLSKEASINYTGEDVYTRVTYFTTDTDNAIVYDGSVPTYSNVPQLENKGVELFAEKTFNDIKIDVSYVVQNPKNRETGNQALKRAKRYGKVNLTGAYQGYDFRGTLSTAGKKLDVDDATIKSYTKLDLGVSRALREDIKVDLSIENLTDTEYETTAAYNTAGRSVYLTLTYTP